MAPTGSRDFGEGHALARFFSLDPSSPFGAAKLSLMCSLCFASGWRSSAESLFLVDTQRDFFNHRVGRMVAIFRCWD